MCIICILVFSACSINSKTEKEAKTTVTQEEKKPLEFKENLLINNKPIINMSYNDVIKNFGKPIKFKIVKVLFPASDSQDYYYIDVLSYDGIDFEFELGNQKSMKPIENCKVWRFDLTNNKYNIGKLRVGMSVEEYKKEFTGSKTYHIEDILDANRDVLSDTDSLYLGCLRRILITSKPKDYYNTYGEVSYQQGVLVNKDGENIEPLGFAILIKDNKIDRIVYGFPNAE